MPIEQFYNNYPPTPDLPQILSSEQERVHDFNPPLLYLTKALVGESAHDIREVSDRLELRATVEDARRLIHETPKELTILSFGTTIQSLAESLGQGFFDHRTLLNRVNNMLVGTPLRLNKPDWMVDTQEILTHEKMSNMRSAVEIDPSYAIFFENQNYMPDTIHRLLDDYHIINTDYIPDLASAWKARTKLLDKKTGWELNDMFRGQIDQLLADIDL